jgi:hypothetical protein
MQLAYPIDTNLQLEKDRDQWSDTCVEVDGYWNHVGGAPSVPWLNWNSARSSVLLDRWNLLTWCSQCSSPMTLLAQIDASLPNSPYFRFLYVFTCTHRHDPPTTSTDDQKPSWLESSWNPYDFPFLFILH